MTYSYHTYKRRAQIKYFDILRKALDEAEILSKGSKDLKVTKVKVMEFDQLKLLQDYQADLRRTLKALGPRKSMTKREIEKKATLRKQLDKVQEALELQGRFKKWNLPTRLVNDTPPPN